MELNTQATGEGLDETAHMSIYAQSRQSPHWSHIQSMDAYDY